MKSLTLALLIQEIQGRTRDETGKIWKGRANDRMDRNRDRKRRLL